MATSSAAIGGAAALALALSLLLALLVRFLLSHFRHIHSPNNKKDSETTASSDHVPSAVEAKRGGGGSPHHKHAAAGRQFRMEELEQATMEFNESNMIGCGAFGVVFKGLLRDGTVVAIKRRDGRPTQQFADEVAYMSTIQHRNLVTLLGYCQESGCQMLVFEYLPNSSIANHLYDTGSNDSATKLEFKQRLSIAIGAAKGLCHLHGLQSPSVHSNFKTSNVLVDENFIAKVADAGLSKLLEKIEDEDAAGSSCSNSFNAFKDPECGALGPFQDKSDVYSFGVFLLELVSGSQASIHSIYQWVQERRDWDDLIDQRLVGSFTEEGMRDLMEIMKKCMRFPGIERPRMENVVMELNLILDHEIARTMDMGEGTATVTLGSQLFTN